KPRLGCRLQLYRDSHSRWGFSLHWDYVGSCSRSSFDVRVHCYRGYQCDDIKTKELDLFNTVFNSRTQKVLRPEVEFSLISGGSVLYETKVKQRFEYMR